MWRSRSSAVLAACTTLAVSLSLAAAPPATSSQAGIGQSAESHDHDTIDVRDGDLVRPTRAQLEAVTRIVQASTDGARVTYDNRFGTPRTIRPRGGTTLTAPSDGEAADIGRQWLEENREAFGLSGSDVATLRLTRDHVLSTGTHVLGFRQLFDGVESVHGGSMTVVVREDGAVESYAGQTVRSSELEGSWDLTATAALERVASRLGGAAGWAEPPGSPPDRPARRSRATGRSTRARSLLAATSRRRCS